jgi:1,4-alpha-glucan branching enzyme
MLYLDYSREEGQWVPNQYGGNEDLDAVQFLKEFNEVVHGKGSLLSKMPGDRWQKMANLRSLYAFMWAHPGKKLLFMGCEFAQETEWSEERSLDWHLLEDPQHRGVQSLIRDLNHAYKGEPALWELDFDHTAFWWIEANDADANVFAFARKSSDDERVIVYVANLSPVPREGYRLGLPRSAAGASWSTPTPVSTAARTSGTSAASRPARSPGRASRSRPRSRCRRWARSGSCPTPTDSGSNPLGPPTQWEGDHEHDQDVRLHRRAEPEAARAVHERR